MLSILQRKDSAVAAVGLVWDVCWEPAQIASDSESASMDPRHPRPSDPCGKVQSNLSLLRRKGSCQNLVQM